LQLLDVLTLNQEPRTGEELTDLVREAMRYFPEEIWEGVNYLGNLDVEHHVRIEANEKPRGAFNVNTLLERMRELRRLLETRGLLLGLTRDPVILSYYRFDVDRFRRIINLVRDYVASDVGLISLFETDEETAIRISAHGLGHNQGLTHHPEPVDLMYVGLLDGKPIGEDGFCDDCRTRLDEKIAEADRTEQSE